MFGKGAKKWWPRMACSSICGYTGEMRRPHLTCLWCRRRRLHYRKLSPGYHLNRFMGVVFPPKSYSYVIIVDETRRFKRLKSFLLKRLLTICEGLAN